MKPTSLWFCRAVGVFGGKALYTIHISTIFTRSAMGSYGKFLQQLLQAIVTSEGDPQVVYPLLARNTDKLNPIFAELLSHWGTNTLAEIEPDTAVIVELSNLIGQFPLGDKLHNMEIAITGYNIALTVYTPRAFPEDWAGTQNNLGLAYRDRILGEKAENVEKAIAAFSAALEVRTRRAFPEDW
ncbi:hypothetical protein NWP17_15045, partial [Chrysosporum bergii ANA360D]|nr:hypothetical protein [Chrysosporum bergii ANA360D]